MKTLRGRLTFLVVASVGLLLMAGGTVLYLEMRGLLIQNFDRGLRDKARMLTAVSEVGRRGVSFDFTSKELSEFQPGPNPEYYQIWLPTGGVLAKSESLGPSALPYPATRDEVARDLILPDGRPGRALMTRLSSDGGESAFAFTLAKDRTALNATLRRVLIGTALGMAALLLSILIAVRLVLRFGLSQLRRLEREARAFDAEKLKGSFSNEGNPKELQPIIRQLNHLLERMRGVWERERRFSAHAAHELLTPIAELRALAEVAASTTSESEAGLAEDALAISKQMGALVETLLQLARSQTDQALPREDLVAPARILEEVWKGFAEEASARGLTCRFDWDPDVTLHSHGSALRTILTNLMKNAVLHTPPAGRIESSLRGGGEAMTFCIGNTDTSLEPEDLQHLFDPLWRKDKARTSSHHSGLGLPLARALADQLDMRLESTLPRPHWFQVILHASATETGPAGVAVSGRSRSESSASAAVRGRK